MTLIHQFDLHTRYFQFFVMDEASADNAASLWTEQALEHMIAPGQAAILPGTLRNVEVRVEIHVSAAAPVVHAEQYDHMVEGAFDAPTGRLMVAGTLAGLTDARRIAVQPGSYQFLYLVSGVDTIGADAERVGDLYRLHLWPGSKRLPRLLKHWQVRRGQ